MRIALSMTQLCYCKNTVMMPLGRFVYVAVVGSLLTVRRMIEPTGVMAALTDRVERMNTGRNRNTTRAAIGTRRSFDSVMA